MNNKHLLTVRNIERIVLCVLTAYLPDTITPALRAGVVEFYNLICKRITHRGVADTIK